MHKIIIIISLIILLPSCATKINKQILLRDNYNYGKIKIYKNEGGKLVNISSKCHITNNPAIRDSSFREKSKYYSMVLDPTLKNKGYAFVKNEMIDIPLQNGIFVFQENNNYDKLIIEDMLCFDEPLKYRSDATIKFVDLPQITINFKDTNNIRYFGDIEIYLKSKADSTKVNKIYYSRGFHKKHSHDIIKEYFSTKKVLILNKKMESLSDFNKAFGKEDRNDSDIIFNPAFISR